MQHWNMLLRNFMLSLFCPFVFWVKTMQFAERRFSCFTVRIWWVHQQWPLSGGAAALLWAEVLWRPGSSGCSRGESTHTLTHLPIVLIQYYSWSDSSLNSGWKRHLYFISSWCILTFHTEPPMKKCLCWTVVRTQILKRETSSFLTQLFNLVRILHEHMDNLESTLLNPSLLRFCTCWKAALMF